MKPNSAHKYCLQKSFFLTSLFAFSFEVKTTLIVVPIISLIDFISGTCIHQELLPHPTFRFKMNILLGVSGSVAAVKLVELVVALKAKSEEVRVRVVFTSKGKFFLDGSDLAELSHLCDDVHSDESEWMRWKQRGDEVLHIELRRWADILLIAPLSANSLGKIANGLCDNLLTSVVRAWDFSKKRLIVCPAMNSVMWNNPLTARHLSVLDDVYKAHVVGPKDDYKLACGDVGPGAMADLDCIVKSVFLGH